LTAEAWSYRGATLSGVSSHKKRSISMPAELDAKVEQVAAEAGTTYSAWLAEVVRRQLRIRDGLAGVAEFEREDGAFTDEERADAAAWADAALTRARSVGTSGRRRRSA
jgi:hypothetical protein